MTCLWWFKTLKSIPSHPIQSHFISSNPIQSSIQWSTNIVSRLLSVLQRLKNNSANLTQQSVFRVFSKPLSHPSVHVWYWSASFLITAVIKRLVYGKNTRVSSWKVSMGIDGHMGIIYPDKLGTVNKASCPLTGNLEVVGKSIILAETTSCCVVFSWNTLVFFHIIFRLNQFLLLIWSRRVSK